MPKKDESKVEQRQLVLKDDNTEYAIVTKKLGNGRFSVRLLNTQNKELIGRLRGKFRHGHQKKENFTDVDTVVLVSIRDFQDSIVDIVHVYKANEVRQLKKKGEFLEDIEEKSSDTLAEDDQPFDFDEI